MNWDLMVIKWDEREMKGKNYEITKENLVNHEMIGLEVKVIKSTDSGRVGMSGIVLDETQNTFVIQVDQKKSEKSVEVVVPKKECEFEFDIGEKEKVIVKGNDILKRAENRVRN